MRKLTLTFSLILNICAQETEEIVPFSPPRIVHIKPLYFVNESGSPRLLKGELPLLQRVLSARNSDLSPKSPSSPQHKRGNAHACNEAEEPEGALSPKSSTSEGRPRSASLGDRLASHRSSPTSSPRRERGSSLNLMEVAAHGIIRDITPRRRASLSKENSPRVDLPAVVNLLRDLFTLSPISGQKLDHEIFQELENMRDTAFSLQPALQMLRFIFSSHIKPEESERESEDMSAKKSAFFEKWKENNRDNLDASMNSCETMLDQFWRMNISAVLKTSPTLFSSEALRYVAQSAEFLAESSNDSKGKGEFYTAAGEVYFMMGEPKQLHIYVEAATHYFQDGLFDRSLECLSKLENINKGDGKLAEALKSFALTFTSRSNTCVSKYKQFIPFLENFYHVLSGNDKVSSALSLELAKFYYRSGNVKRIADWDIQRLQEMVSALFEDNTLSEKEKNMLAAESFLILAVREVAQTGRDDFYLMAAQSFYKAQAYMECFNLISESKQSKPRVTGSWAEDKFQEVQEHVFALQLRKWDLSYLVTGMLQHALQTRDDISVRKALDKWISSKENADCIWGWFQKIMAEHSAEWLMGKKIRLFRMFTSNPEYSDPSFFSLTESGYCSWMSDLLEVKD